MVRNPLVTPVQGQQMYIEYPGVLWCEHVKLRADGRWSFNVINGDWTGVYDHDTGEVYVNYTKETYNSGHCVWVGKAPFSTVRYNEAILWIKEQLPCATA